MKTLITGHEADIAATENTPVTGEFHDLKIRLVGYGASLAHPMLNPGRQDDGSIVLIVTVHRPSGRSMQEMTAKVLATTFAPHAAKWYEEGCDNDYRVTEYECRQPLIGFGAGQICDYWDGTGQ